MARSVSVSGANVIVGGQQNLRDVAGRKESSGFVCDVHPSIDTCDPSRWTSIHAVGAKAEVWGVAALGSSDFAFAGKTNRAVTNCIDYNGGEDGFVGAKTAVPGTCSHFLENHNDEGLDIAVGPDYTYVVGTIGLSNHQDALVVRYDGANFGATRTQRKFSLGGPGLEEAFEVAIGDDEMIYVTGRTSNDLVDWCNRLRAQCWGADINRSGTDLFVAGIHSDAAGMRLSWLYQQESQYSTGQGLAYYRKNDVKYLVVVGVIDEGINNSGDANCKSRFDRSDEFTWTNGLVLKFELDEFGVHLDPINKLQIQTYGSCTGDAVADDNGESFKSVAVGDAYIFVAGTMRGPAAVCWGTRFFPHCESNDLEDALLLALHESDLSIFGSYEFVGDAGGDDHLDIFIDVAVEGGYVYMVGATKSIHNNMALAGGMDAFVVRIDEPN